MGFGGSGGGGSVAGSSDVALNGPLNNDVLTYDSASSKWKNAVSVGGGGAVSVQNLPAGTTLSLLFAGGVWPARPTSRTDILVQWIDSTGSASVPEGALVGDLVIRDVS